MEKIMTLLAALLLLAGCTQNSIKRVEPIIEDAVKQQALHPETYKPLQTKKVFEGKVHNSEATYWKHIPYGEYIDVVVFSHSYSHDNRSHHVVETSDFVIMSPDLQTVYYVQWDNGTGLPWERKNP